VIKSDAPVVPVYVFGTFHALNRRQSIPHPHKVVVRFGKPLDFSAFRNEAKTCSKPRLKEIYQEVADRIMKAIAELK
jgi:1-acyl-sn-glycerol-3-phosphate acyltransferase